MRVFGKTWAITLGKPPTYLHSLLQLALASVMCVIRASVSFSWLWPSTSRSFPLSISLTTILKFCCPFRILISSIASVLLVASFFFVYYVVKYTFYFIIFYLLFTTHLLYICRHYSTVDILFRSFVCRRYAVENSNASVVLFYTAYIQIAAEELSNILVYQKLVSLWLKSVYFDEFHLHIFGNADN